MEKREKLGSRLGFILLSAGCAIGCGNVWKFPWMCGQYGGGAFLLVYFIFLIILGIPMLSMEFALGRSAQVSPVKMYHKFGEKGRKFRFHGYMSLIGSIALMAFYTVVAGWIMYYLVKFATGTYENLGFGSMISNPTINVSYMAVVVIVSFTILMFDISKGLENITKKMMLVLFALMIVLSISSMFMSGAAEGLKFYLIPDFGKINGDVIVAAMNQAFFSLSVGMGSMAIFGSYIDKGRSLLGESITVASLDTLVAIMAGLIIFPSCYTFGIEPGAGPSLLFDTMAVVFSNMQAGRLFGTMFFAFMTFAALSTVLTVCENTVACVCELLGWKRRKACMVSCVVVLVLSLTTALGYSVWHFEPFAEGSAWLDLWDFIVSSNFLPFGSVIIAFFCTSDKFGWGWDNFMAEVNTGKGIKVKNWMKPIFKYVAPLLALFIYIYGIITFNYG